LQPRTNGADWSKVNELLYHTLNSIKGQANQNFIAFVCGHDYPDVMSEFESERFIFIRANFERPDSPERGRVDKRNKRHLIANEIHRRQGGYMMYLDADDFVHKDLVDFVLKDNNRRGYVLSKGYAFDYSNRVLGIIPGVWRKNFSSVCGSSGIVYFRPEDLPLTGPEAKKNTADNDLLLFFKVRNHKAFEEMIFGDEGHLDPIPFPAGVYVINNSLNLSYVLIRDNKRQEDLENAVKKWCVYNQSTILEDFSFIDHRNDFCDKSGLRSGVLDVSLGEQLSSPAPADTVVYSEISNYTNSSGLHMNVSWNEEDISEYPWMPQEALECFIQHIKRSSVFLEYGAGGSSVLAADSGVKKIYSVESDKGFLCAVQKKLEKNAFSGEFVPIPVDIGPTRKLGKPVDKSRRNFWPDYYENVWIKIKDNNDSPDLVLIDGRFRVACFLTVLLKASCGTIILFDDYFNRRNRYGRIEDVLSVSGQAGRMAKFIVPKKLNYELIEDLKKEFIYDPR
jgi:hypothetical protein